MLAALFWTPKPKVDVSVSWELIIIPPSLDGDAAPPSVSGVVTLQMPAKQRAQRLYVTLEGKSELYADGKWPAEEETVLREVVELPLGEEELDIGNHVFSFIIDVPASTPVHQRCPYGRVLSSVVATLELAPMGSVSSPPKRVYIAGVPYHGDFPPPFEMVHEHVSGDLGPVRVQVFSPHLGVSSLVHVRTFLASTPTTINLDSIRLSLTQSFTIHYANATRPRNPPSMFLPLQYIDTSRNPPTASEFKSLLGVTVNPGKKWEETAIFRVGSDPDVRGSSAPGTTVKILVSHRLSIDIRYRGGARGNYLKSCVMELPVQVGYCEAIPASWSLPEYASHPPKTKVKHTAENTLCLCEYSHAELLELYGEALKAAAERVITPPTVAIEEPRDRQAKSPAVAL